MKYPFVKDRIFSKGIVWLAVILTVLALNITNITVHAANIIDNGDYVYKIQEDGKSVSIVRYKGNSLYISLPSRVEKYSVTAIDAAAFMSNDTIKELEISNSIKKIDSNAFAECTALQKLIVPGNVEEINDSAFIGCTALRVVYISDGVKKIGNYCFSGCEALSELSLPESLDEIGEYAFFGCSSLEKIAVPKSLKRFGGYALEGTEWMKRYQSELVMVGDGMLIKYNGTSSTPVLPDSVKTIGECAFAKNRTITNVQFSKNLTKIEKSAFEDCSSLENVILPDSVVSVGERAFRNCEVLDKVVLSKKLTKISKSCFEKCGHLREIVIPSTVRVIEEGSFKNCPLLENVTFEKGLQEIQEFAFENCTNIKRVVFPETLKEIASAVFGNCYSLTRVEFNSAVKIPSIVFSDCIHLNEVVFYKEPVSMAVNIFNRCSPDIVLYSDGSPKIQDYAKENNYQSENISSLSEYIDKGILHSDEDAEKNIFSGGYTAVVIIIMIVDFGIVTFFTCYILFSRPKGKHGKNKANHAKYSRQRTGTVNIQEKQSNPQPRPKPQNSAPKSPQKPVPKHIAPKDKK